MANQIATHATIAKASVAALAATTPLLSVVSREGEMEFGQLINGTNRGSIINVRVPAMGTVVDGADITSANKDVVEATVPLALDIRKTIPFSLTSKEKTFDANEFQRSKYAQYVAQLGNANQEEMLGRINAGTPNAVVWSAVGTNGMLQAKASLLSRYAPVTGRSVLLGSAGSMAVTSAVTTQFTSKEKEYVEGSMGKAYGADFYEMPNSILVTRTNASAVTISGSHAAATSTIKVTSTSGDVFGKGSTFRIAGVYAIDAMTGATTTRLANFVVTASVTATGATTDLVVFPAMVVGKTVSAKPAASAAVSFDGASGVNYEAGFMLNKDAVRVAFGDLEVASDKKGSTYKANGYSLRIQEGSDILTDVGTTRFDTLAGIAVVRPEWIVKVLFQV